MMTNTKETDQNVYVQEEVICKLQAENNGLIFKNEVLEHNLKLEQDYRNVCLELTNETEQKLQKAYFYLSALVILLVLLVCMAFLHPSEVWVGDVCLSCWGKG